jgi:hypothetical protein
MGEFALDAAGTDYAMYVIMCPAGHRRDIGAPYSAPC